MILISKQIFSNFILFFIVISSYFEFRGCISHTYEFESMRPLKVINPFGWDISVKCLLKTDDFKHILAGRIIIGRGRINGRDVGTGMEIEVKSGDAFDIDASSEAVVEITNKGQSIVVAECILGNFARELAILKNTNIDM